MPFAQTLSEGLTRCSLFANWRAVGSARWHQQHIQDAVFGRIFGLRAHALRFVFARLLDSDFSEVSDDGVDIAPHVTDLSKFCGFDFDKRRVGKLS